MTARKHQLIGSPTYHKMQFLGKDFWTLSDDAMSIIHDLTGHEVVWTLGDHAEKTGRNEVMFTMDILSLAKKSNIIFQDPEMVSRYEIGYKTVAVRNQNGGATLDIQIDTP